MNDLRLIRRAALAVGVLALLLGGLAIHALHAHRRMVAAQAAAASIAWHP